MKKALIIFAILFSSVAHAQIYVKIEFRIGDLTNTIALPSSAPDSILVEVDTVPSIPFNTAASFYASKVNAYTYRVIDSFLVGQNFYAGNLDIQWKYACGQTDSIRQTSYLTVNMNANLDTIINYIDSTGFCAGTGLASADLSVNVEGTVNSANQVDPVNDHTMLYLLSQNASGTISVSDSVGPSGSARTFSNLDTNLQYTVIAIPQSTHSFLHQNNLPTYLGNQTNWQNALWISVTPQTTTQTITLATSNTGNGSGTAGGNTSGGSPRNTGGDPVEDLLMILTDVSGNIIDFQFTDSDGDFLFEMLDDGEYRLFGESLGRISDVASFDISNNMTDISGLDFEVTDTEILYQGLNFSVVNQDLAISKVYPNPVQTQLHIEFQNSDIQTVDLVDLQGRVIESHLVNDKPLSIIEMSHVNNGVYHLRFTDKNGQQFSRKVIKM